MPANASAHEIDSSAWVSSDDYQRGLDIFNEGRYFDAHEILEDVWRPAKGNDRKFLQGLIQVAVALHHHSCGNLVGARSVLKRAAMNLMPYPDGFGALHLGDLRQALSAWREALENGGPEPAPIKFRTYHRGTETGRMAMKI